MTYGAPAGKSYLDARATTASQPELQLMLLDGACRFGRQARELWDAPARRAEAERLLLRALDVVEELARSVSHSQLAPARRLADEYAFIFRQLGEAHLDADAAALDRALEMLAYHRETWRLACERIRTPTATPTPNLSYSDAPATGFSFQA